MRLTDRSQQNSLALIGHFKHEWVKPDSFLVYQEDFKNKVSANLCIWGKPIYILELIGE